MTPRNPLAYVRLSDLRATDLDLNGHSPSLSDQGERIRAWCAQRGWPDPELLAENDLTRDGKPKPASAFKRRKVTLPNGRIEHRVIRPVFRGIIDRLAAGRNDGLVALDLDRACRDPRDLEDLIDLAEQHRVTIESVTGSLRLASDADVTMARVMVAMGNKESRDKARRVAAARERQAHAGQWHGGKRPYGFDPDGLTRREDECAVVREAAYALLRGATLRGLARDLNTAGTPTVTGNAAWSAQTLRDVLTRPRNAGRAIYRGEVIGAAPWEPIVPGDVHDRVVALLTDRKRDTRAGRPPRHLLSGLARCGVCDDGTTVEITIGGRAPRYRCRRGNHLSRAQQPVDELVVGVVLGYIRRDFPEVFVPASPVVDAAGLRAERTAIEDNLEAMAADAAVDTTGRLRRQLRAANERAAVRLGEIEAGLAAADGPDPTMVELATAADPHAVWEGLALEKRRMVVATVATVTILPTGRAGRGFNPASVRIEAVTPAAA